MMMRLSPPASGRFFQATSFDAHFGGGEANVSVSLAHLGISSAHVTRFPDNELGYAAGAFLKKHGVDTRFVQYGGPRLGLYFFENGSAMRPGKVVYDRAGSAFDCLNPDDFNWEKILEGVRWFHWTGITPAISAAAAEACRQALSAANKLGIYVSADVNFRKNLWRYGASASEVMEPLVAQCDLIVCGPPEATECLNITPPVNDAHPFIFMAEQLMKKFPKLKKIIATRRDSVSANHNRLTGLHYDESGYMESATIEITPIVDRIGGGDAFMAGYIYAMLKNMPIRQALEFATAASALKHTFPGDVNLATAEEIEALMNGNNTGRLIR